MSFISEKDLYVFVFSPDKLSDLKTKEISENKEKFKTQLDMLINMKQYLSILKVGDISQSLYERIEDLEEGSNILLDALLSGQEYEYFIYDPKSNSKY